MTIADAQARAGFTRDLRSLADFLDAHPDLPVGAFSGFDVVYFPSGTDEAQVEEVERVAGLLAALPQREGEHYVCQHRIGRAAYRVVAIPEETRARHRALMSYADNLRPEWPANRLTRGKEA